MSVDADELIVAVLRDEGQAVTFQFPAAGDVASFVAARTACSISAARRRRTNWMLSLQGSRSTDMGAPWRPAWSAAQTSGIGSCAAVSHWTGLSIRKANTVRLSGRPSKLGVGYGQAASSSRGYTGSAFVKAGNRMGALRCKCASVG
jgi:hypothetical protein